MPCYDARDYNHSGRQKLYGKIDSLTDMLCRLMTEMDMDLEGGVTVPQDIEVWWKEHQIRDRERKAAVESLRKAMVSLGDVG